jgi:hypothetical protein
MFVHYSFCQRLVAGGRKRHPSYGGAFETGERIVRFKTFIQLLKGGKLPAMILGMRLVPSYYRVI